MKKLIIEHEGFVLIPRKTTKDKKVSINLNTYRNLHYQVNNQCKQIAKENIKRYLQETGQDHIRFTGQVNTTFQLFKPSKRKGDKSNVYSVATKYFYDALVELGIIPDDNDDIIKQEILLPTELDRENPRIVITVEEI